MSTINIQDSNALFQIRKQYHAKYDNELKINGVYYPEQDKTFVMADHMIKMFGHLMMRASQGSNPENILLKGPQGCGKTETAMQFAAIAGLPVLKINCALIREPRDWFGYKSAEGGAVFWVQSEFSKLIERGGAVVLLDEISRATPPVLNAILPLLDSTGFTFLEEVKQTIRRGPDLYFFATANIGNQFTGTYGALDKALDDRFAIRINVNYLTPDKEAGLLVARTGINKKQAEKLVKVANLVRTNSSANFGGKLSTTISTRNLLDTAILYQSLGNDAFEYTILPMFCSKGGTKSQEAEVRQIIQSQFGS